MRDDFILIGRYSDAQLFKWIEQFFVWIQLNIFFPMNNSILKSLWIQSIFCFGMHKSFEEIKYALIDFV